MLLSKTGKHPTEQKVQLTGKEETFKKLVKRARVLDKKTMKNCTWYERLLTEQIDERHRHFCVEPKENPSVSYMAVTVDPKEKQIKLF